MKVKGSESVPNFPPPLIFNNKIYIKGKRSKVFFLLFFQIKISIIGKIFIRKKIISFDQRRRGYWTLNYTKILLFVGGFHWDYKVRAIQCFVVHCPLKRISLGHLKWKMSSCKILYRNQTGWEHRN